MPSSREWNFGDKVVHAKRPEWGTGVVTAAQKTTQDGVPCQRLTIRFDRAGVKTLSTAHAELVDAAHAPSLSVAPESGGDESEGENGAGGGGGWLAKLEAASPEQVMLRLPEGATDPFKSLEDRLRFTLNLYRFSDQGGSLLDWAASQSGLKDPLSRFNRHELEALFKRFAFNRDEHLKKLVLELKKKDPPALAAAVRGAPPAAQQALRRIDIGR